VSKQTAVIRKQCQDPDACSRDAKFGLYRWRPGDTDVNLNTPVRVFCGKHKPKPGTCERVAKLKLE
jgi:hypothetical protein